MPAVPPAAPDPKSVKVNLTAGTGVDIEWKDGHFSHFDFPYLRGACPCALCDDERAKEDREPWEKPRPKPGELPIFKPQAKAVQAEAVGKYAIRFTWSDGHEHGIFSWDYLRDICPCAECAAVREAEREHFQRNDK
jgi:DUF971 family protein